MAAIALALGFAATAVNAAPPQPTAPAPHLTNTEAERAFAQAMFICLGTREGNQTVKDAPEELRAVYGPASEDDRSFAGGMFPSDVPMWVSRRLGYLLYIFEPSPERCEVHAMKLPVEAAFRSVVDIMQKNYPEFSPVSLKPGSPIAYQFEHVENGMRYIMHMEGAEAGALDKAQSFSILNGVVVRQAASENSPFR